MRPETYLEDIQEGWNSFLSSYFDGSEHNFGGSAIMFPDCTIGFSRPQLGQTLSKPLISLSIMTETTSTTRGRSAGGRYKMVTQPTLVNVITADKEGLWDINDGIQNKLDVLLNGAAGELSALGMKPVGHTEATHLEFDSSHEYQISQRIVRTRQELEYPLKD